MATYELPKHKLYNQIYDHLYQQPYYQQYQQYYQPYYQRQHQVHHQHSFQPQKTDHLGYKTCFGRNIFGEHVVCMVTLLIPAKAITNEARLDVVFSDTAKFRTNIAYVQSIVALDGTNELLSTAMSQYDHKKFIYTVGQIVKEFDYDHSMKVCKEGIHYYLTPVVTIFRIETTPRTFTGISTHFYNSGSISAEDHFVNGIITKSYSYREDSLSTVTMRTNYTKSIKKRFGIVSYGTCTSYDINRKIINSRDVLIYYPDQH